MKTAATMLDSDLVAAVFNRGKYIFFKQKNKSPDKGNKSEYPVGALSLLCQDFCAIVKIISGFCCFVSNIQGLIYRRNVLPIQ